MLLKAAAKTENGFASVQTRQRAAAQIQVGLESTVGIGYMLLFLLHKHLTLGWPGCIIRKCICNFI